MQFSTIVFGIFGKMPNTIVYYIDEKGKEGKSILNAKKMYF